MMIDEFKKLQAAGRPITPEVYKLVEFVYTYHPLNLSKETCAVLYDEFGEMIFLDMLPRAKKAAKITVDLQIARAQCEQLQKEYESLDYCAEEEFDLEI